MTSRAGSTVSWSSYNYPTAISASDVTGSEEVQFLYGPDRQRWKQIYTSPTPTETTYYVGGLMDVVFVSSTTNYRHYIYAGREPIAVYSRTAAGVNTMSYMLEDHQGGVSNIASKTGAVDVNESFSAFGTRRNPTTWSGAPSTTDLNTIAGLSRQGYTFQTWLGQSMGLNHMNGRVQDAILGRFLSPDPHIPDPSDAQSYDRYTYAGNNPLTYVDPSGFEHCPHAPCPDVGDGSDGGTSDGGAPGGGTSDGGAPDGGAPGGGTPTPGVPGQTYTDNGPGGIPNVTGTGNGNTDGTPTPGVPGQFYNPDDPSGIPNVTGIGMPSRPKVTHTYSLSSLLDNFSLLNPAAYRETVEFAPFKFLGVKGLQKLFPGQAALIHEIVSMLGLAAIPLYEAGTAYEAELMFFNEATDNLPTNLPGQPYGSGVDMGGGVYWQEDWP
jgi:RHS repeat-associated protein